MCARTCASEYVLERVFVRIFVRVKFPLFIGKRRRGGKEVFFFLSFFFLLRASFFVSLPFVVWWPGLSATPPHFANCAKFGKELVP